MPIHFEDLDVASEVAGISSAAGVKVIEGMRVAGIMNGRLGLRLPGDLVFSDCKVVPISRQKVA